MDPTVAVLQEIRRRIVTVEQAIFSGNGISAEDLEQLYRNIESCMRDLLRLEGHVSTEIFDRHVTVLQALLRILSIYFITIKSPRELSHSAQLKR